MFLFGMITSVHPHPESTSVIVNVLVPSFLKTNVNETTSPALSEPKLWISSEKTNFAIPVSSDFLPGEAFFVPELQATSNTPNKIKIMLVAFNLKLETWNLELTFILLPLRQLNHDLL